MYDDIQPLHEKQYEILKELKRVCDENGLTYFLAYGTLIGAVRHKGFIPWDDDIDTGMPLSDYRKLQDLFITGAFNDRFFLQSPITDPDSGATYYKLRMDGTTFIVGPQDDRDMHHGINIDIYPLYNMADNQILRRIQLFHAAMYLLMEVDRIPQNNGTLMKILGKIILTGIPKGIRNTYKQFCHQRMAQYENKKTKYKAFLFGNLRVCKRLYPAEAFERTITMKFEGDEFSVPAGYDLILRKVYGDYMQLPPEDQRGVKLDKVTKIDTEQPYSVYKGAYYCKNKG